jgi:flagellar L-ring protein FlgH
MRKIVCIAFFTILLNQIAWGLPLFQQQGFQSLVADRKAHMPGDLLTVLVMENSNAQTGADLSSGKDIKSAMNAGYNQDEHAVHFGLSGHGQAQAKTGRNNKIKAQLTVRIQKVFPNQTYQVQGMQTIRINGEQQTILLSGIVRPEDISFQNTVLSTRLADAQITYTGDGSVSNAQNRNYVYRILSLVGLV